MGYMLQQDYLFPWKTIQENIMLGLHTRKFTMNRRKHTLQLLKQVGLHDVEELYPANYPVVCVNVALVRTLATDPKILLLDEPFSALDYQTKLKLEELVFSLLRKYKKTSLLVTHDIEEAIAMSDRIYLLQANPGKIENIHRPGKYPFLITVRVTPPP